MAESDNGGNGSFPVPGNGEVVAREPPAEPAPLTPLSHLLIELSRVFAAVPQTVEHERSAYIMALVEMARLVRGAAHDTRDAGLWNAQQRLFELAYALQDLDAGQVAPVLRKTKPKGNPPDSSLLWMKRVRVLTAMRALQQAGVDLKQEVAAAAHIAEKYPELKSLMNKRGRNLSDTILHWRRALEEAKPGTFLRQYSEHMMQQENLVADLSQGRPDLLRNFAYNTLAPYLPLDTPN